MGHLVPWGNNLNTSPRQQQAEPPLPPPLSSLYHQTSPTPASAHLSLQAASPRLPMPRGCPVGSPGMAFLPQPSPFSQSTHRGDFQQPPRCPLAPRLKVRTSLKPLCPAVPPHTPIRSPQPGKRQRGNNSVSRRKSKETFSRTYRTYSPGLRAAACPQQAQPVPQEPQFTPQFVPTLLGSAGAA